MSSPITVIDGTLAEALLNGATVVLHESTEKIDLVLVKNPKGSEWNYVEHFRTREEHGFVDYYSSNHTLTATKKEFYEDLRMYRKSEQKK